MKKALTQIFIFLTLGIVCYLVFCFVPGMHGHTHTIAETLTHMAPCKVVLSAAISGALLPCTPMPPSGNGNDGGK